jgi:antitoxin component of MazEF toxin-antitoxin module
MEQQITVGKWGHGFGIRLPKRYLDENHINEKSKVSVQIEGERLILTPAKEQKNKSQRSLREIAFANEWDGEKYELIDEDYEWLNMKAVGEEEEL